MKKELLVLVILALLANFVSADTNVDIGVQSNEDINIWANPNTPGTTNYFLEGVNYKQTVNSLKDKDLSISSVYWRISEIFMEQDNIRREKFTTVDFNSLDTYNKKRFRKSS